MNTFPRYSVWIALILVIGVGQAAASLSLKTHLLLSDDAFSIPPTLARITVHAPHSTDVAIIPENPWEKWAVFAYNTVLQLNVTDYRLYYDCIGPADAVHKRFTCLALSTDGVVWKKPLLGVAEFQNSTQNNIVFPLSDRDYSPWEPGAVFVDTNPQCPSQETFKMLGSVNGQTFVYASPDGIRWKRMYDKPSLLKSDTMNVGYYDEILQNYVFYVRLDDEGRRIARCVTNDLSVFEQHGPREQVFYVDEKDPEGVDVYTSSATRYEDYHLFFPSFYYHFSDAYPWGFHNDGLLDIRLLQSRDGLALEYVGGAWNARSPIAALGVNTCDFQGSVTQKGGWCPPTSALQQTQPDTSATYMATGWVPSVDGERIYLYRSGQPFTHGGDTGPAVWGDNTIIHRVTYRRDGFASVDGDYIFRVDMKDMPQFTTTNVTVPTLDECSAASQCVIKQDFRVFLHHSFLRTSGKSSISIELHVNMVSSVVGGLWAELQDTDGQVLSGFSLVEANQLKGDFVSHAVSWGQIKNGKKGLASEWPWEEGYSQDLSSLAGKSIRIHFVFTDTRVYAYRFVCVES